MKTTCPPRMREGSTGTASESIKPPEQQPNPGVRRRHFLAAASRGVAAFMILPRQVLGGNGSPSPNNKLNIAGVGIGGQGAWDVDAVNSENIVALCDVDAGYAAKTFNKYPKAKRYKDFREMLEKEKSIDAVVVGTPDHNHAVVSIAAIHRGKHVYCEKPLTRTVVEARAVAQAAREAKVATQMGNQGMAFEGNRLLNEWLWDGAIGSVHEVHVWSDRPTHSGKLPLWWPQGIERPTDTPPVPATLDWDLWLGAGAAASISPGVFALQMARVVGFWHGRPGRYWLPLHGPGVPGSEIGFAHQCSGGLYPGECGDVSPRLHGDL